MLTRHLQTSALKYLCELTLEKQQRLQQQQINDQMGPWSISSTLDPTNDCLMCAKDPHPATMSQSCKCRSAVAECFEPDPMHQNKFFAQTD